MHLRPITFRYKKPCRVGIKPIQYGLIAEEVNEVYPDLVAFNKDGQPETVQYYKLDAMLLNEVQKLAKEHDSDQNQITKLTEGEAELMKAHAADQAKIAALRTQVGEMQQVKHEMTALEARLARLEAGNKSNQTNAASRHTKKQHAGSLVAKVQF